MKINYKFNKDDEKLEINWEVSNNKLEKNISIKKDDTLNLNNLYDAIIDNIDELEFEEYEKNDDNSLAYKAATLIIEAIKDESKKIKEQLNKFKQ